MGFGRSPGVGLREKMIGLKGMGEHPLFVPPETRQPTDDAQIVRVPARNKYETAVLIRATDRHRRRLEVWDHPEWCGPGTRGMHRNFFRSTGNPAVRREKFFSSGNTPIAYVVPDPGNQRGPFIGAGPR